MVVQKLTGFYVNMSMQLHFMFGSDFLISLDTLNIREEVLTILLFLKFTCTDFDSFNLMFQFVVQECI